MVFNGSGDSGILVRGTADSVNVAANRWCTPMGLLSSQRGMVYTTTGMRRTEVVQPYRYRNRLEPRYKMMEKVVLGGFKLLYINGAMPCMAANGESFLSAMTLPVSWRESCEHTSS